MSEKSNSETGPPHEGIVAVNYGKQVEVLTADGVRIACEMSSDLGQKPVAGDRVRYSTGAGGAYLQEILPRSRVIRRAGRRATEERILAANIDLMLIVSAVEPVFKEGLVDRYLVTAGHAGIDPLIVLNKIDLDDGSTRARAELYRELGYSLYCVSSIRGDGVRDLSTCLAGRTSILVGHSGVGKSSLLMALVPGADTETSGLSTSSGKGVHTTSTATLYSGSGGVRIIDSPGIRAFGLSAIEPSEVGAHFVEFVPLAAQCRFRNCMHVNDGGCAVRAAAENGDIPRIRYDSYLRILESLS
jgi:ribosome biogenesis GTPase